MNNIWIIYPTVIVVLHLMLSFVYCFWFVYLLRDIINKRSYYRAALIQMQGTEDSYQQHVVYNAETKYTQTLFIFFLNTVEWVALTFVVVAYVYLSLRQGLGCSSRHNSGNCFTLALETDLLNSSIYSSLIIFAYNLLLLSLTLVASLCNYLTARYAKKSWIKSDKIPFYIILVLVIMLLAQLTTLFCFLTLIVRFVHLVITSAALVVAIQQARRLRMVVEWMIVDLKISQTDQISLQRLRLMNKRLKILFTVLFSGMGFLLISMFIADIQVGTQLVLQSIFEASKYHSICTLHNNYLPDYASAVFSLFGNLFSFAGIALVYTPYICSGLFTMSVLSWRRFRGRTGFKTHYPNTNSLKTPLIK